MSSDTASDSDSKCLIISYLYIIFLCLEPLFTPAPKRKKSGFIYEVSFGDKDTVSL